MANTCRKWVYALPIVGDAVSPSNFSVREEALPELREGEALARIHLINVHSATRARMTSGMTALGETDRTNYARAEIIQSRDPAFREGDVIACQSGWQDHQIVRSADPAIGYGPITAAARKLNNTSSQWTYAFRPELVAEWPASTMMDVFGTSGMTAWFGMRECGPLQRGETVVVAGASGSVGALVAQIAQDRGCRVIGIAGGDAQCIWVKESFGIAACLDYRAADFPSQLTLACRDGVDVFSDGIGGALTQQVAPLLNTGGRLFSYGSAAAFYDGAVQEQPSGARPAQSLRQAFGISPEIESIIAARQIRAECWIVDQFYHERLEAEDALAQMMREQRLQPVSTVVAGFSQLPDAISNLYRYPRRGKLQISFTD